jgi:Mrp family chromosome partitioning ATPase
MSKHAAVLGKAAPQIKLFGESPINRDSTPSLPVEDVYSKLAANLFDTPVPRTVIAFTSVQKGEGVTYVVRGLAAALARAGKSVVVLDGGLRPLQFPGLPTVDKDWGDRRSIVGTPFESETQSVQQVITGLHDRYDCVLLDCGSIGTSAGLTRLAPLCDGVVVVVEAGRLSEKHVARAAQFVSQARGTLLGTVLNKRRYPIPSWIYSKL